MVVKRYYNCFLATKKIKEALKDRFGRFRIKEICRNLAILQIKKVFKRNKINFKKIRRRVRENKLKQEEKESRNEFYNRLS
jgi:hypothetical protein